MNVARVSGRLARECGISATQFTGSQVGFDGAQFTGGTVSFGGAKFAVGKVSFDRGHFVGGYVGFVGARFTGGELDLHRAADWSRPPIFSWQGAPPLGVSLPADAAASSALHILRMLPINPCDSESHC